MSEVMPGIIWPFLLRKEGESLAPPNAALEKMQFLTPQERASQQFRQLKSLATFTARHSAHFRARLDAARLTAEELDSPDRLRRLSPLKRRDIQQHAEALDCSAYIPAHGPFRRAQTSGSTGEPVILLRTEVQRAFWMGHTIREHHWHGRDVTGTLAVIRALPESRPLTLPSWGPPLDMLYKTGPAYALPVDTALDRQVEWLNTVQPDYLLLHPNNLAALLDEVEAGRLRFDQLKQFRTIGETLSPELCARVEALLQVSVADVYSSQELGVIACQCPVSGHYHVMENLLVEVLDEQGRPSKAGQTGRVVVTDLYSFATPLLRYETGDYAEAGEDGTCPCGRGMQTLHRIWGRERNMLRLPGGERRWPLVGMYQFREIANIMQFQIIQHDFEQLEMRLVCHPKLSLEQEARLRQVITSALRHDFALRFTYYEDRIPRGANGKHEEFLCAIAE